MQWTTEQAWEWVRSKEWICGFNYVPSAAVHTTEFWQAETFDSETIDRELGLNGQPYDSEEIGVILEQLTLAARERP